MKFGDLKIFDRLRNNEIIRIVAAGASNTQRYLPGAHWFDYVEIGFKNKFGGQCSQFINAGVNGNTTVDLLKRMGRDLLFFQPHLIIMTVGGNDCNPVNHIDTAAYRNNLFELHRRIMEAGAEVIFQTYYACDLEQLTVSEPQRAEKLVENMEIIREVAAATGSLLQDNERRWAALRDADAETYRLLMLNPMHVNAIGNMVIGLDLMRRFDLPLCQRYRDECAAGLLAQALLDRYEK